MKPLSLENVKIEPINIGAFTIHKLEIDLRHINYGLDPLTKRFRTIARSNFCVEEVINIFRLLDDLVIEPTSIIEGYAYFSHEVSPFWLKGWFRLVFCIELKAPKAAGIITIYQLKKSKRY